MVGLFYLEANDYSLTLFPTAPDEEREEGEKRHTRGSAPFSFPWNAPLVLFPFRRLTLIWGREFFCFQTLVGHLAMVPKYVSAQAIKTTRPEISLSLFIILAAGESLVYGPFLFRSAESAASRGWDYGQPEPQTARTRSATLLAPWSDAQTRDIVRTRYSMLAC